MQIFISHASDDKKRLRPLLDALLTRGDVEIFIDRPLDFGYRAKDLRRYRKQLKHLPSGQDYAVQLRQALFESEAVLGCLSKHLTAERTVFLQELSDAQQLNRLVTCIIDGSPPETLPERVGDFRPRDTQSFQLDPTQLKAADAAKGVAPPSGGAKTPLDVFHMILHELERRAETTRAARANPVYDPSSISERQDPEALSRLLVRTPRLRQTRTVERVLLDARKGGARPLIVAGPKNEAVEDFVGAIPDIWTSMMPKGVKPVVLDHVDLPPESAPEDADHALKRALAPHLGFSEDMDFDDEATFARGLGKLSPGVVLCVATARHVRRLDETLESVERWLAFWGRIAAAAVEPKPKLAPVLPLVMDAARPGWDLGRQGVDHTAVPRAGGWLSWLPRWALPGGCVNKRVHDALSALATRSQEAEGVAPATYLPILNPVRHSQARTHLGREMPGLAPAERAAIAGLFPKRGVKAPGLPMSAFVDDATELLT